MERIKIQLPEQFSFSTIIPIRIGDINYGGHVGNDSFLSLIHDARLHYLQQYGCNELSFFGSALIMTDVAIEFKKEISFGDTVQIWVTAAGFDKLGFDLYYRMEIMNPEKNILAAKAKTGMLCFDYSTKKKMAVPLIALDKLV